MALGLRVEGQDLSPNVWICLSLIDALEGRFVVSL